MESYMLISNSQNNERRTLIGYRLAQQLLAVRNVHDVHCTTGDGIVYTYWVAQSGMGGILILSQASWNGTVQILPSDNIPPIPWIKAILFHITDNI